MNTRTIDLQPIQQCAIEALTNAVAEYGGTGFLSVLNEYEAQFWRLYADTECDTDTRNSGDRKVDADRVADRIHFVASLSRLVEAAEDVAKSFRRSDCKPAR